MIYSIEYSGKYRNGLNIYPVDHENSRGFVIRLGFIGFRFRISKITGDWHCGRYVFWRNGEYEYVRWR